LSHNSFDPGAALPGIAPFSWFVNLAVLFESAVRQRLAAIIADGLQVTPGRVSRLSVFPDSAILVADPDMVVSSSSFAIAGDVKYKNWYGTAEASDLYQLLIHARAFDANRAFLIFPSDSYAEIHLGPAVTGCETWLFTIDVRNVDAGLRAACESMSIATRAETDLVTT
jgi:5-methylcytosine-specific restriction endonuclease McrBC regulatory subunit McrC